MSRQQLILNATDSSGNVGKKRKSKTDVPASVPTKKAKSGLSSQELHGDRRGTNVPFANVDPNKKSRKTTVKPVVTKSTTALLSKAKKTATEQSNSTKKSSQKKGAVVATAVVKKRPNDKMTSATTSTGSVRKRGAAVKTAVTTPVKSARPKVKTTLAGTIVKSATAVKSKSPRTKLIVPDKTNAKVKGKDGSNNASSKSHIKPKTKLTAKQQKELLQNQKKKVQLLKKKKKAAAAAAEKVTVLPLTEEELKKRERGRRNWEGNSDSEGSVDSGVLEENICYECGELTADLPESAWTGLIICDRCDLDYHTTCVGFEAGALLPRHGWQCPKCIEEQREQKKLDFTFPQCREIFDALKVHKRAVLEYVAPLLRNNKTKNKSSSGADPAVAGSASESSTGKSIYARNYTSTPYSNGATARTGGSTGAVISSDICYSPSRPLSLAWSECASKGYGYMMVSHVFPYEVMKQLTHGYIENYTSSGRVCDRWLGFVNELTARINAGGKNIVNRGGRWDITLPKFVVDKLDLPGLLAPITEKLCAVMGQTPPPQLRTHNIVLAPIGSMAQQWHCDDTMSKLQNHRYFTILIALNTIGRCSR